MKPFWGSVRWAIGSLVAIFFPTPRLPNNCWEPGKQSLLLISITFTPKTSHSCLKKMVLSYVFQEGVLGPFLGSIFDTSSAVSVFGSHPKEQSGEPRALVPKMKTSSPAASRIASNNIRHALARLTFRNLLPGIAAQWRKSHLGLGFTELVGLREGSLSWSANGLACWFGAFGGLDSWNPPKMKGIVT